MALNDVTYPASTHTTLSTAEETLYTIPTSSQTLQVTIIATSLTGVATGMDLKFRPDGATDNERYLFIGSDLAGAASGKLQGGSIVDYDFKYRLSAGGIIAGVAETASAINVTISPALVETT